jgi:hypothetical protein
MRSVRRNDEFNEGCSLWVIYAQKALLLRRVSVLPYLFLLDPNMICEKDERV